MSDVFSRVALVMRPQMQVFQILLAQELKKRYGSKIYLYSPTKEAGEHYAKSCPEGLFEQIKERGFLLDTAFEKNLDYASVVEKARYYEKKIGLTYNEIAVYNRHFGRGYAPGGCYHPKSRYSENAAYVNMLHFYNTHFEFWENEFRDNSITLLLDGNLETAYIARLHGIPFRALTRSRYKNYWYWGINEFNDNPDFEEAYNSLSDVGIDEKMTEPYYDYLKLRQIYSERSHLAKLLSKALRSTTHYVYWKLKGHRKAKGYYLAEMLKLYRREWSDMRRLKSLSTKLVRDMNGEDYVYFPLHVEPELGFQGLSPEFFFQSTAIIMISRDLPAGSRLGVKEIYEAVGRRPERFYDRILELKNAFLFEPGELGFNVVKNAKIVVTICGTAGLEAVALGKPVVTFGQHNIYNFLPTVRVVKEFTDLKKHLSELHENPVDEEEALSVGRRFLKALTLCSVDMRDFTILGSTTCNPQAISDSCDLLARSVRNNTSRNTAVHAHITGF